MSFERWRFVMGYVGYYSVSSAGRVRSERTGLILTPGVAKTGYPIVSLHKNGHGLTKRVHRLVAFAFLGLPPDGHEVNHKDGNKLNAALDNLEYVTRSENMAHAWRMGLRKPSPCRGEKHHGAKLTDNDVRAIRASSESYDELVERYGLSRNALHAAKTGRTWKHVT